MPHQVCEQQFRRLLLSPCCRNRSVVIKRRQRSFEPLIIAILGAIICLPAITAWFTPTFGKVLLLAGPNKQSTPTPNLIPRTSFYGYFGYKPRGQIGYEFHVVFVGVKFPTSLTMPPLRCGQHVKKLKRFLVRCRLNAR